jgi:hypothetical protein
LQHAQATTPATVFRVALDVRATPVAFPELQTAVTLAFAIEANFAGFASLTATTAVLGIIADVDTAVSALLQGLLASLDAGTHLAEPAFIAGDQAISAGFWIVGQVGLASVARFAVAVRVALRTPFAHRRECILVLWNTNLSVKAFAVVRALAVGHAGPILCWIHRRIERAGQGQAD